MNSGLFKTECVYKSYVWNRHVQRFGFKHPTMVDMA